MLVRESRWNEIRSKFSEDEKSVLRAFIGGTAICPKGWIIDEERLRVSDPALCSKLAALAGPGR